MQNIGVQTKNKEYIVLVASMELKVRQTAEAFNSHHRQGGYCTLCKIRVHPNRLNTALHLNRTHITKQKDHPRGGLSVLAHKWRTRKASPEKALNGLFPAVAFPQKSESNGWQDQNIFFQQNLNCGQIRTATP